MKAKLVTEALKDVLKPKGLEDFDYVKPGAIFYERSRSGKPWEGQYIPDIIVVTKVEMTEDGPKVFFKDIANYDDRINDYEASYRLKHFLSTYDQIDYDFKWKIGTMTREAIDDYKALKRIREVTKDIKVKGSFGRETKDPYGEQYGDRLKLEEGLKDILTGKDPIKMISKYKFWYDWPSYASIPDVVKIDNVFKGMDDHKVTHTFIYPQNDGTKTWSVFRFKSKFKPLDFETQKKIENKATTYQKMEKIFTKINKAINES